MGRILNYIYVLIKSAWVKNSQKILSIFVKKIIVWRVILKAKHNEVLKHV